MPIYKASKAEIGDVAGANMSSPPPPSPKSPLEAAQQIVNELNGMTKEQQQLSLRFAMEAIGLQLPAQLAPPAPAPAPAAPPTPAPNQPTGGGGHSTDIRAFTAAKAPSSDQQFAAVVAYFYQIEAKPEDRRDTIDADTMKEAARLAARPQVQHWAMTLNNAKNAGYLDSAGPGSFKLSSVGENLVAITLPGGGTNASGKARKKSNAKKIAKKKRKR
jgi:hypothetical protein